MSDDNTRPKVHTLALGAGAMPIIRDANVYDWSNVEMRVMAQADQAQAERDAVRLLDFGGISEFNPNKTYTIDELQYTFKMPLFNAAERDAYKRLRDTTDTIRNAAVESALARQPERHPTPPRVQSRYLRPGLEPGNLARIIAAAAPRVLEHQKRYSFDAIVCRGVSGLLYAAPLSVATGIPLTVVRKTNQELSHSEFDVEGLVGPDMRYAFVDDFIVWGNTFNKCRDAVKPACIVVALVTQCSPTFYREIGAERTAVPVHGIGDRDY